MKIFYQKYKFEIYWLLVTIVVIIIVNIVQMYSREETLNKVNDTNFNLIYKFYNENHLDKSNFKNALIPFLSSKKFARIHMAIVFDKQCVENASHYYNNPLLCPVFHDFNTTIKKLSKQKQGFNPDKTYFSTQFSSQEDKYQFYQFKKLDNSNSILIMKKNDNNFSYFITNRLWQGWKKILEKSNYIFLILFSISFLLYVLFKLKQKWHSQIIKELEVEKGELINKLNKEEKDKNDIKSKLYENEIEIDELKLMPNINKELTEKIKNLSSENDSLMLQLFEKEDIVAKLYQDLDGKDLKIWDISSKISSYENELKNKELQEEHMKLEKLWRHDPSWNQRQEIERTVVNVKEHIPFTVTQGFLAFEYAIKEKSTKQIQKKSSEKKPSLEDLINEVCENRKECEEMHKIRQARNNWFHKGIYPTKDSVESLIKYLERFKIKPKL